MVDPNLIDFHCHLDLYPDHATMVANCERARVFTLAMTSTPKAWIRNYQLASPTRYVRAALGLHPQLVAKRATEITLWDSYLPQTRYVGEVGLDARPASFGSLDCQKQVFEHILKACARSGNKILSVHSTGSGKTVLDMIEDHLPSPQGQVVLHWFTGTHAEARRAADLGCYFSVNSHMLSSERHRAMIAFLPLDRLLTETDGPFTHVQRRPTQPTDVATVIDDLARARLTQPAAIALAIRENFERLVCEGNGF